MTRRTAIALAALQVALQLLGLSHALAGLPDGLRLAAAFLAVVLLPGVAWLAVIGVVPPGGPWLAPGWALGLGVAWQSVLVLVATAVQAPFTAVAGASAGLSLVPWAIAGARAPHARTPGGAGPGLRGVALVAVLVAAALAAVHVARLGTPVTFYSDSPDHIGTIRRMMASGSAFPTDAFFRDAGPMGADPRKGLWHPIVALLCVVSGVDPWPAWRLLGAFTAPLFVLNAASFAWLLGGPRTAALGAWALLLTYGGSLSTVALREAGLATKLADQLAIATATAVLADLDARTARSRVAAIALALGAVFTHVFAALEFATVFAGLGVGMLVRDRGPGPAFRRLAATAVLLGAACLPYLLWRAHGAYAPVNPIHTEPQGLVYLGERWFVVNPGTFWEWLGWGSLLFPLSAWAWARASARTAVLYLLTTTVAVFAIMLFPPLTMALQPKLGYLLMRFVWLLPLFAAVAFAVDALLTRFARSSASGRIAAAATLAGVVLLLRHPLADAVTIFAEPAAHVHARERVIGMDAWRDALSWMDANLPEGTVVLSDPATSYAVPMATRHWVATLVDQHSSPNDSLAVVRLLQARDALDPSATWERTREVIEARGITAIALNDRFQKVPAFDYWAPTHEWYRAARARFDAEPGAFPRVYDRNGFVVYRVDRDSLARLSGGGRPRPAVHAAGPGAGPPVPMGKGLPELQRFLLSASRARPGDTLLAVCTWTVSRPLPAGSYKIALRFDRPMPPGFHAPAWIEKPARKLYESWTGRRFRFRADHLPAGGAYGVDLWKPGEWVEDSARVVVPVNAAAGRYEVQVRVLHEAHYPNYHLRDFLMDRDYYSGVPVDTLAVMPRGEGR